MMNSDQSGSGAVGELHKQAQSGSSSKNQGAVPIT